MAQVVLLKHSQSGLVQKGVYGFSWTTFFFGGFPAIFRGDILTGAIVLLLSCSSFWIAAVIWAFLYNKVYTTRLLERGYVFADTPDRVYEAKRSLGIVD